jgi:hypothetical protein
LSPRHGVSSGCGWKNQSDKGEFRHRVIYRLKALQKRFCYIGQGEARHRKYKRLKLGGGHVYDRSSV